MPLADWSLDATNFTAGLYTTSPLSGSSSVQVVQNTISQARYFLSAAGSYPQGRLTGRLRTLIRANQVNSNYRFGLGCLASARTIATVNGNWYAAWIVSAGPTASVALYRGNGVQLTGGTSLATGNFTFAVGTTYAFQLDWIADNAGLGGTYLNVWVGTATDFSNLASVVSFIDISTSKIVTGSYEGLMGFSGTTTLITIYYDMTSLFS